MLVTLVYALTAALDDNSKIPAILDVRKDRQTSIGGKEANS